MRLAAALIAALLLPVAAGAQTMEFGCPDPGTTFTYDSGVKVTAKGRDGMDCLMQIVDGKPYRLRALLFEVRPQLLEKGDLFEDTWGTLAALKQQAASNWCARAVFAAALCV